MLNYLFYRTRKNVLEQSDVCNASVIYKKSVEDFSITYIEAASYGKPSIGGIYGGGGDAIKSGQTGYLCNEMI